MIIGGIQKNSLIDYPSKISCVIFTQGCNFNCPYCHNPKLVRLSAGSQTLDTRQILSYLKKRKPFLDGVVVSGGEPTIQKDLLNFCLQIKEIGYPVKIDTNGNNPSVIQKLIDSQAIDYIAMDIKTDPNRYSPYITKSSDPLAILSTIQKIINSGIPHEFRTTCVKPIVDEAAIRTIAGLIRGDNIWILQKIQTHSIDVLQPKFFQVHDWVYDDQALDNFRALASKEVQHCMIREQQRDRIPMG